MTAPNEKRVVKITVEFKTDAGGKTYTNLAAAAGDNGSASGRSPEIEVVSSGFVRYAGADGIHYQLIRWLQRTVCGGRMISVSLQESCTG